MDKEILIDIIKELPQLTTREMFKEYNEIAPIQIKSYNQFLAMLTEHQDIYDEIILSKENRQKKLQLALQEAESALIENASSGDIRSIEFLLKTQKEEYRDRLKIDMNHNNTINIVQVVQDKLQSITGGSTIQPDAQADITKTTDIIDAQIEG